ncbi:MAG: TrbI/VirB10 family protein [Caulobacteraceae bacterium]
MSADDEMPANESEQPAPQVQPKTHVPPATAIRAAPPKPKQLSRKTLMAGSLLLSCIVAFALVNGLSDRERRGSAAEDSQPVQPASPPESVRDAQAEYSANDLRPPIEEEGRDYLWGDHRPEGEGEALDSETIAGAAPPPPSPLELEADAARMSAIRFGGESRRSVPPQADGAASPPGPGAAFVASQRGRDDGVLDASYRPPRSPYAIQAGSTISAALVTALNSDQPGRVVAQVTEDIYDSVTGDHLLVPQGSRLLGTYDAATNHGDQRLLVVWNRLIMPNGWSIALRGMPGTDAAGASGVRDSVDQHLGRIAVASLLSGALSVAANAAEDDDSDALSQNVGNAAAQEAARVGGRIIDRELNVRPTLHIRAGAPVRVLVSQDIILRPYPR